jgi:hypothetical protein
MAESLRVWSLLIRQSIDKMQKKQDRFFTLNDADEFWN